MLLCHEHRIERVQRISVRLLPLVEQLSPFGLEGRERPLLVDGVFVGPECPSVQTVSPPDQWLVGDFVEAAGRVATCKRCGGREIFHDGFKDLVGESVDGWCRRRHVW